MVADHDHILQELDLKLDRFLVCKEVHFVDPHVIQLDPILLDLRHKLDRIFIMIINHL